VDTTVIVLIVVIVLLVLALAAAGVFLSRRRRSEHLQEHYGPEYERSLDETGDRRSAEAQLTEREKRHSELDIRDLRPEEREQFGASWATIQRGFVDDPVRAVREADELVVVIMRTRGYPVDDFERRAEDVSVEHPEVVQHYREARAVRDATESGSVDTEQQRHAVTSYRSLIDALLGRGPDRASGQRTADVPTTEEQSR
jgi:FtsZ-interacting cell division protein ZipA